MNDDRDMRTAAGSNPRRRRVRVAMALLLAALGGAPPPARSLDEQPVPAPPASKTPDPLEEFVPREKVEADSVVAFPVDI